MILIELIRYLEIKYVLEGHKWLGMIEDIFLSK